ncbi:MAG: cyclase family protein [Anaerolineales bacterium]|nr:cyclase family protein [Anaerolineales bacterium]
MRFYDISLAISPQLPTWPGDPPIEVEKFRKMGSGSSSNSSRLTCSVHTGTHVDAPIHFVKDGSGVDSLPLNILIGRAYVVDLPKATVLDAATLEEAGIPPRTRRVLFKTKNSSLWAEGENEFIEDYVAVDASGAEWLVRKGFQLVGVDYLSVGSFKEGAKPHRLLLGAGMVILEGINLSGVRKGRYTLYCLPLKIIGCDGAPARALLAGV